MRVSVNRLLVFGIISMVAAPCLAQDRPQPALDVSAGWAGFADDSILHHGLGAVAARFYLTPRLSVGPEVVYMVGPGLDRDLFAMANAAYEWPLLVRAASPRLTPFVIVGGGYMRHQSRFSRAIVAQAFAVAGGGGVRVRVTDRLSIGSELRTGWELHVRFSGVATIKLGS